MAHNGNRGQVNLGALQYSRDYAYINHLKSAQNWDYSDNSGRPDVAFMNAQGYPKNLNSKTWRTVFYKPHADYYSGNWIIDWIGECTVGLGGSSTVSGFNTGVNGRWVITNNTELVTFTISAINVANPPTQIRIYRADHEDLQTAGEIYTPLFLEKMAKCGVIRIMDRSFTNGTNAGKWESRTPVDYFSYACSHWDITKDAGSTSHSGDAYTCTLAGYTRTDKAFFHVKWDFTNTTTTPTIDPEETGAKTIKRLTGSAVAAGTIVSGRRGTLVFDTDLDAYLLSTTEFDEGILSGEPPEMNIALANKVNAHLQMSIPHMGVDVDWASSLAALGVATLNAGLKLRVQIGNELFNTFGGFIGGPYSAAKGLDRWPAVGSVVANDNWHGRALSLVGETFRIAYTGSGKEFDLLMGVQSAGTPDLAPFPSVRSTIMESPLHVLDGGIPASEYVTHVMPANYWGTRSRYPASTGTEASFHAFIGDAWEWATASADRKLEITETFYSGAQDFITGTGASRLLTWWNCAQNYNKILCFYEGANSEDHVSVNPRCRVLGISKAAQAVVTMPSGHGFRAGMLALFKDIQGMTEINALTGGSTPIVVSHTDTTFTINVDSTGFGTFTSGDSGTDFTTSDLTLRGVGFGGDGVSLGRDMCNDYLDACRDSPITYDHALSNLQQHISLPNTEFPSHYSFSGDIVWSGHPPPGYIYTPNASWEAFEDFSTNDLAAVSGMTQGLHFGI